MANNSTESTENVFPETEQHKRTPKQIQEDENNRQHKKIFEFRIKIYKKLFWSICIYIVLIFITIWGNTNYFCLADSVLIALLSTTTANVLGLFYIASKWLFPNKE